jgi:COP9 signalosome complex subunit 1
VAFGGLIALNSGNFREAADLFLKVNPIYLNLQPLAGINFYRILTPNDIAIYGGLCALATMDIDELRTHVLENQPFRQFLELESHLRRAINMFCASKFTACLGVLDSYAADYKLDLYLQVHFKFLYKQIRSKSLVRWFSAFSVIELGEVKKSFPPRNDEPLEKELEDLIYLGILKARIDVADQVRRIVTLYFFANRYQLLVAPEPDPRITVIEDALEMAKFQERSLRLRLHRCNMQAAGLEVKAAPKITTLSNYDDGDTGQEYMKLFGLGSRKNTNISLGGSGSSMI